MTTPPLGNSAQSADEPRPARKPDRPQAVLDVIRSWSLTPRLRRVRLGGPGIEQLRWNDCTDKYVKLLLPGPGNDLEPPYDLAHLREHDPDRLPARRTYTVRSWDREAGHLDLDVVLHPDADNVSGIAACWSCDARPGHRVAMHGAGGGYAPDPAAREHLLIGDHAALPAIAASLEAMPSGARGRALIHLAHEEDLLDLAAPEGMDVDWVIGDPQDLLLAVRALPALDPAGLQVFCHAERGLTKALRRELIVQRSIPREQFSISAYWALGRIEDQFQAEKREAIGRIDD